MYDWSYGLYKNRSIGGNVILQVCIRSIYRCQKLIHKINGLFFLTYEVICNKQVDD